MRQLNKLSGHSKAKLERINNFWLERYPQEDFAYDTYKYLIFDGTYFHKTGCLITVMDAVSGQVIINRYVDRERYENALVLFNELKRRGVKPKAVTLDGHKSVMAAVKDVWPDIILQRCLYHIQHEGMRWLRSYPKTQAGQELRVLLSDISAIIDEGGRDFFMVRYEEWQQKHGEFVRMLKITSVAHKDLKKAMTLINNALADMFHFLKDNSIESTTNKLESFYSRLKLDYQRHRGMSEGHKVSFLRWYCYFKNEQIINTF